MAILGKTYILASKNFEAGTTLVYSKEFSVSYCSIIKMFMNSVEMLS